MDDDQQNEVINDSVGTQNKLPIVSLVIGLVFIIGAVVGYVFFVSRGRGGETLPTNTSSSTIVSPAAAEPVSTSSSELSKDDSLNTLKEELKNTSIDDFSSDFQNVESDVNGL